MSARVPALHDGPGEPVPDGPLLVVTTAKSGHADVDVRLAPLLLAARERGRPCEVSRCDDVDALESAAKRAADRARDENGVVVASGGDGSIGVIARQALRANVPVGLIPGGTFNLFARTHGIPEDFAAAADTLFDGRLHDARVGSVNGTLFFVNASLGLYPRVLVDRERFKQRLGRRRWVAIVSAIHTISTGLRPLDISLELDGRDLGPRRTPTVFVGNNDLQLDRVGIEPPADSGSLIALTSSPLTRTRAFELMWAATVARLGRVAEVERHAFESLVVRDLRDERKRAARLGKSAGKLTGKPTGDSTGKRRRSRRLALDGETFRVEPPWTFAVHPEPLRLVVPRAPDP